MQCILRIASFTLYLCTLHLKHYILYPTHCILQIESYPLHPAHSISHIVSYALHFTYCIWTLYLTHWILYFASYTTRLTPRVLHIALNTLDLLRYIWHIAYDTLHLTYCILKIVYYTLYLAHYIIHIALTICVFLIATYTFYTFHFAHFIFPIASYTLHLTDCILHIQLATLGTSWAAVAAKDLRLSCAKLYYFRCVCVCVCSSLHPLRWAHSLWRFQGPQLGLLFSNLNRNLLGRIARTQPNMNFSTTYYIITCINVSGHSEHFWIFFVCVE